MKRIVIACLVLFFYAEASAFGSGPGNHYDLPDSVNAVAFIASVNIVKPGNEGANAGLAASGTSLQFESGSKKSIVFRFPGANSVLAKGIAVKSTNESVRWDFDWQIGTDYKLLIVSAPDSAGNFSIYSGYLWLPGEKKWKLIGTCRYEGRRYGIREAVAYQSDQGIEAVFTNAWAQRGAGGWKSLEREPVTSTRPTLGQMPALDSIAQLNLDRQVIVNAMRSSKTEVNDSIQGVYYKIVDGGTGNPITVTDTIFATYSLRIFGSSEVISGGTNETYKFPLSSLIKGWQLVIPLIKTGGSVKIVIPSGQGYSIRTRGSKIPPNSILEFEVKVTDSKPAVNQR